MASAAGGRDEAEGALFEVRKKIYPRSVTGWFATWRWALVWFTQVVFYGLPWLAWNDRQAVLFDLAARKFYIFGLVFWPQDFIYLTLLLVIAAVSLFLFTAVAGRLWCGYACPQTVYTEIFLWIERKIEGDRNARTKLDAAPLDARKFGLKAAKHGAWIAPRLLDRLHLRRLLHAHQGTGRRRAHLLAGALGDVLDLLLRLRHLRQRRAGCASRSASTCAPTRASRARCSTRTR